MQTLTILGATGSIGQSTLAVIERHPERFKVYALTAHSNYKLVCKQAVACHAQHVVISDERLLKEAREYAKHIQFTGQLHFGTDALHSVAQASDVTTVMAAIVGGAGLLPTLAAVNAGKKVLLANKESLVMSGELFVQAANQSNATILPIDSEHNAIFQCLPHNFMYGDLANSGIRKILLTGSGGPFLHTDIADFSRLTPAQACAHPNWVMGQKISIDSATMMNKGLEFIEARWLFGLANDDIDIVLHPQSTIHSMVQYTDGSVLAQMGNPDMRTPIAHALAYPERIESGVPALDFSQLADFTFTTPCNQRYPNLYLALAAAKAGQSACTALNAANEIAVDGFLKGHIAFTDIARVNEHCLETHHSYVLDSIDTVLDCDKQARVIAHSTVQGLL